jgi:hypothetical protein
MTTTSRQNNLILNQDWTRIYQTFRNADFKSYDFENLRRVIIAYLRENYPEDFNDYIESSEYMALVDAIAFMGQSLSFRMDLNSRENFLELADRKESVLRLARMLGYNAKRNVPASGLLKFSSVSTSETVVDSTGRNLSDQIINWNDPTNTNWLEQFLLIINAAMADNTEFGRSQGSALISNIATEQYRFRSAIRDVPIFSFSKTVASRGMTFEIVSTAFRNQEFIYEEAPTPGNQLGFVYRQDGRGPGSANTGFYLLFKQGTLELADFVIDTPSVNERVNVAAQNINNDDVWLFSLDSAGAQITQWIQVSNLVGNNIAYNSLTNNIRNIYSVITKENDRIELSFADGVYGNLPRGSFRTYYRISNGLRYTITPSEMRGISITVPYISKLGNLENLTITLNLNYTVTSSAPTEDIDRIKSAAPALYYTQNRMITAEDYQLAPLSSSQDILKVKSINRTSSGISRNFDIIDASGRYSSVNVFGDDGFIYKKDIENFVNFKFTNRFDIINFIRKQVEPAITGTSVYNFFLTKFDKIFFTDINVTWENIIQTENGNSGYFKNIIDNSLLRVANFSTGNLKFARAGALIKFIPPVGKKFKNGELVDTNVNDPGQRDYVYTKIVQVVGDGTNAGRGALPNGEGPVKISDKVPTGAIARRIIPSFVTNLPIDLETEIVNQLVENQNFGLRYDINSNEWKIITAPNVDINNAFTLGKTGDITRNNLDSSWIIAFVKQPDSYNLIIRGLDYVFGSKKQNRFYLDVSKKIYNSLNGEVVKDRINVLSINTSKNLIDPLKRDISFFLDDTIKFSDGYESPKEIVISFSDKDDDGVIDDPDSFEEIVGEDIDLKFLYFKEIQDNTGNVSTELIDTSVESIVAFQRETDINVNNFDAGQLIYFYDLNENRIKRVTGTSTGSKILVIEPSYRAYVGRDDIKFQYIHNSGEDRRIDPSVSNIIDVYLLTRSYDTDFRRFISGETSVRPEIPTSDGLRISYGAKLSSIKSISDEVIYHPVRYKILFGREAEKNLQASFKIVKNPAVSINDNDLKVRIINSINDFFDVQNWDFGDKFYLGELITYVLSSVAPDLSNIIIVPRQTGQVIGDIFEIRSRPDEIFVSGATVDDIEIVSSLNSAQINVRY